jgi:hypothetical protein
MSGPKETSIRPSVQRQARRHLSPLLSALQAACVQSSSSSSAQKDLEQLLVQLREELRRFEAAGDRRAGMLDAVRKADTCLTRLAAAITKAPTDAEVKSIESEISSLVAGSTVGSIESTRIRATGLLERRRRANAARQEAEVTVHVIRKLLSSDNRAPDAAAEAARKLADATKASIDRERALLRDTSREDLNLGSFDSKGHAAALDAAASSHVKGDLEAAARNIEEARAIRERSQVQAASVRQQITMRDELAAHLASVLERRNYDRCDSYLVEGPGGDERPLVIYAHNPAGKAHVRLTLPLNDQMTIEVDGVADGEEEICVDVLEAFQQALEETGDGLDVIDAGRATRELERSREKKRETTQIRQREPMRDSARERGP